MLRKSRWSYFTIRLISSALSVLAINSLNVAVIYGKPGDLDRSFGNNGSVTKSFAQGYQMLATAIQPDGKAIAVGAISQPTTNNDFYVLRFNDDGSFDSTFNGNGSVIIPVSTFEDDASNLAIQNDGKIVICGYSRTSLPNYDISVVRLNADGSLDSSFNGNGIKILSISSSGNDFAAAVALQSDNKIVVTGSTLINGQSRFALIRLNTDGSADATFDGDGIVTTQFPQGVSGANSLVIGSDGKIVVVDAVGGADFSNSAFGIARYETNGSLDATFGSQGTVFADVRVGAAKQNAAQTVVIQPDGKIVAAGDTNNSGSWDFGLIRLNPDGTLDNSFDGDGKVITAVGTKDDYPKTVVLDPNGKLLVGGKAMSNVFDFDFAVVRYNPDGSTDGRFGSGGIAIEKIPNADESITSIRVRPDGKIDSFGVSNSAATFVRFLTNGSRESNFDGDWKSDIAVWRASDGNWYWINSSTNVVSAFHFGSSGDVIVPGDFDGDGKTDFAVFRPSNGTWYIWGSTAGFSGTQFGLSTDLPSQGDFDGDGKTDIAVFRPSNGTWYVQASTAGFAATQFGANGDKPVVGDYDGDGKADIAVYRPTNGNWYQLRSTAGFAGVHFGVSTDKVVPADYDGDGKTDLAVYRDGVPGTWFLLESTAGFVPVTFGTTNDTPVPGDFDGDGKADVGVFRSTNGTWYLQRSTSGFLANQFGVSTDKPVEASYVPMQ